MCRWTNYTLLAIDGSDPARARQLWNGRKNGQKKGNGANGIRTHDLLHAMQALSQLSYGPVSQYVSTTPLGRQAIFRAYFALAARRGVNRLWGAVARNDREDFRTLRWRGSVN